MRSIGIDAPEWNMERDAEVRKSWRHVFLFDVLSVRGKTPECGAPREGKNPKREPDGVPGSPG